MTLVHRGQQSAIFRADFLLGFHAASLVAKTLMAREGIDAIELFALPVWLVLLAFSFGLVVSLLAGSYPAARAARVDPVEALRND